MQRPRSVLGLSWWLLRQRYGSAGPRVAAAVALAGGLAGLLHLSRPVGCPVSSRARGAATLRRVVERSARLSRLGAREARAVQPDIAPTGDGYGLAWTDLREENPSVYFVRLDAAGQRVGVERRLGTTRGASVLPRVLWTGSGFVVAYTTLEEDRLGAWVQRLDAQGAVVGRPVSLDSGPLAVAPTIAWTGNALGATWLQVTERGEVRLRFGLLDGEGKPSGRPRDLRALEPLSVPRMAWSGTEFAVAEAESRDGGARGVVTLTRLNARGEAGRPVVLDSRAGEVPTEVSVATDGARAALSYVQESQGNLALYFVGVGRSGPERAPLRLTQGETVPSNPTLAWSGTRFGLSFDDFGHGAAASLGRLGGQGEVLGVTPLTGGHPGAMSTVRWDGSAFAATWVDTRGGDLGLYFTRINLDGARVGEDRRISTLRR